MSVLLLVQNFCIFVLNSQEHDYSPDELELKFLHHQASVCFYFLLLIARYSRKKPSQSHTVRFKEHYTVRLNKRQYSFRVIFKIYRKNKND